MREKNQKLKILSQASFNVLDICWVYIMIIYCKCTIRYTVVLYVEIYVELYVCKYIMGNFHFIFLEWFENQREPLFS